MAGTSGNSFNGSYRVQERFWVPGPLGCAAPALSNMLAADFVLSHLHARGMPDIVGRVRLTRVSSSLVIYRELDTLPTSETRNESSRVWLSREDERPEKVRHEISIPKCMLIIFLTGTR